MRDISIKVYDKQKYDTHSEEAENHFSARIKDKDNLVYLTYKDASSGVNTLIKVSQEEINIVRSGKVSGRLNFKAGQKYRTVYQTPYGGMPIEIHTRTSTVQLADEISIYIEYDILIQGEKTSSNIFRLSEVSL